MGVEDNLQRGEEVKLEAKLNITFLGTRGEIEETSKRSRRHSCFLIEYKSTKLLVEFGTGYSKKSLEKYKPDYVLISHTHPDHSSGALGLEQTEAKFLLPKVVAFGLSKKKNFNLQNFKVFEKEIQAGDLSITPFKTWHSTVSPSYGFIIRAGSRKIVYTSDVAWIPNRKTILEGTWLYIGDGSFFSGRSNIRKVGDVLTGHAPITTQLGWCKENGIKRAIFTHFGSWAFPPANMRLGSETYKNVRKVAVSLSRIHDINVHFAYDGRSFSTKTRKLERVKHHPPYASNTALPPNVKSVLPSAAQTLWRKVFNKVHEQKKDENLARQAAWGAVKQRYRKGPEGKWVKLERLVLPGRYLVAPHARLIWEGKKTLLISTVRDEKYIGQNVYFLEDARVYGILKITKVSGPFVAKLVKDKLRHRHRITEEEWEEWAKKYPKWNRQVYVNEFTLVKKFDKPVYYEPAPGTERWVSAVELPSVEKGGPPEAEVTPPEKVQQARHRRDKCMKCDKPPNVEVLYAEGKAHAWFCEKDFIQWKKEEVFKLRGEPVLFGQIINKVRVLPHGIASEKWKDGPPKVKQEEETLPISSSGEEEGEEVTLDELLTHYDKPFFEKRPFIILTGGVVNRGSTKGDFDFIINHKERIVERDRPVEFRIFRALPEELQRRCTFHYGEFSGPFTSHIPLFDRICIPSEWRRVIRMEDMEEFFHYEIRLSELKEKKAIEQAQKARRKDAIEPLQFVIPAKPMIGHTPGERYTVESVAELVKRYPAFVQKKYDGVRLLIMKDGETVIIRLYTGIDVTSKLPGTVKEVQSWSVDKVTIDSDSEIWKEGKYIGREMLAAYLASKRTPDDTGVVHNIFDVLYFYDAKMKKHDLKMTIGDLHKEPYSVRLQYLKLLPFKQSTVGAPSVKTHFNLAPTLIAKSSAEVKKHIKSMSRQLASEGAVIKWDDKYPLTGACYGWAKYKKTADVHAIVLKKLPTKVAGVNRYRIGVKIPPGWNVMRVGETKGKKFMDIGKTGSLKKDITEGAIVTVNYEELFYYIDPETQKRQLVVYVPHIVEERPEQNVPDGAEEIIISAKSKGLLVMKREALGYLSQYERFKS